MGSISCDHRVSEFSDKIVFVENADDANIARLYSAALGRSPDIGGQGGWEDIYNSNISAAAKSGGVYLSLAQTGDGFGTTIAGGFTQSVEFQAKYGALNDLGFVAQLYQNVLSRTPDPTELNAWLNLMHNGDANGLTSLGTWCWLDLRKARRTLPRRQAGLSRFDRCVRPAGHSIGFSFRAALMICFSRPPFKIGGLFLIAFGKNYKHLA